MIQRSRMTIRCNFRELRIFLMNLIIVVLLRGNRNLRMILVLSLFLMGCMNKMRFRRRKEVF